MALIGEYKEQARGSRHSRSVLECALKLVGLVFLPINLNPKP